ncbi:cell division protein ZapE [Endozoicomonadaceae bacterium StTr2]
MTPEARYRRDMARDDFFEDQAQARAVGHLQRLYEDLINAEASYNKGGALGIVNRLFPRKRHPLKGLYFWGGVGRGKTYLVDMFYDSLPFEAKMRTHFHRFMRRVHGDLKQLEGEKNPLEKVADGLAKEARVICFDEFFVSDITDAMILAGLLQALFDRGVTLVATSNIIPQGLYENGLQRARFLPAIDLLLQHTEVVNVDSGVDYRLRVLEQAEIYHWPAGQQADIELHKSFLQLSPDKDHIRESGELIIEGRPIPFKLSCEDIVWFDFKALCDGPRSQNDYIELAREYHTVILSDVPQMSGGQDDQVRRFINLVDEFYDRGVKLIMSGATEMMMLYSGGQLEFEFKRTLSRLQEMQSHEYLARPHLP